ncbi:MAG: helix-hairpin-helix domain-containing protein, partial [Flavobacterium sp.]
MRFSLITMAIVMMGFIANAQIGEQETDVKDIIESVAENLPDDYDMTELIEMLTRYKKHPINLNKTSPDELKTLLFLSPLQISNFFAYVKENGNFVDVLELQSIDGFDIKTVQSLLPFVTLNTVTEYEKLTFKNLLSLGESDLLIRFGQTLQTQKGFTDLPGNRYLGSSEKFQSRYRYHYGTIVSAALTPDKDAGEKFSGRPFDFYSGNVALFKLGKVKKLIIGDYTLQFGQGLTMWSGFAFGKGPDVTSVARKDLGLRPYTSANEYSFLRGASATINLYKNFDITPFVSFRKLDASQDLDAGGNLVQATVNQSGYHRTPTEIENKGSLKQQIYGLALQYNRNQLGIGAVAYQSEY